jgi:hypothetical protein
VKGPAAWEPPEGRYPETPIYDQLRVELAVRHLAEGLADGLGLSIRRAMDSLVKAMASTADGIQRFMVKVAEAQLGTPEDVLDRIRADQATLDWAEAWRAERGQL